MAKPVAIVLAAGRGTRMGGDLPKVLAEAAGQSLLAWVLEALAAAGVEDRVVVVGYRGELVEREVAGKPGVSIVWQREQRGTGDAVAAASAAIRRRVEQSAGPLPVVVVCGDSPMLRPASVKGLLEAFEGQRAACILGTARTANPEGLGRIVRDAGGRFLRIVEEKDATPAERAIAEVNMSTYVFDGAELLWALDHLRSDNASGEYYLTDCPSLLDARGRAVDALPCLDASETLSVNTPQQLAAVDAALRGLRGRSPAAPGSSGTGAG
jgi:bifunctional UDP-N-acetylglucosamine pyrophosphorylase/glucosamine-1-phosphate N-acetyltransferase/UDP-N-acetylglucosamine pyrophosphorylase